MMVSALVLGLAAQASAAEGPHGAATTGDQRESQEALLGDVTAAVESPAAVDGPIWAAAVPGDNELNAKRIELGRVPYYCTSHAASGMMGAIFVEP
jgi:plastocyanin